MSTRTQVLLIAFVFSKWPLSIQDSPLAGMPLSNAEYEQFFRTINSPHRVTAVCFIRAMYGCQNSLIQTLDRYENHGVIPEGGICSDLPESATFPDFCTFTFYRCTLKKYFVKRVLCPGEIGKTSPSKPSHNEEVIPDNTVLSTIETFADLLDTHPTASTTTAEPFPELVSDIVTPTAATAEAFPELFTTISVVATTEPPSDLSVTTKSSSEFPTNPETSTAELTTTTTTTTTRAGITTAESLTQPPSTPASTHTADLSPEHTTTTAATPGTESTPGAETLSAEPLVEFIPTTAEPLTDLTVVSSEETTTTTAAVTTSEPLTELPTSTATAATSAESFLELPTSAASNKTAGKTFHGILPTSSAAAATQPSSEFLNVPITQATTSSVTSATSTTKPSAVPPTTSTVASSTHPLSTTRATTHTNAAAAAASSVTTKSPQPVAHSPVALPSLPSRSNASMNVVSISTFFRHNQSKSGAMVGITSSLQISAGAADVHQAERIPGKPEDGLSARHLEDQINIEPANEHPWKEVPNPQSAGDLEDPFFQLHKDIVMQLAQRLQTHLAKVKGEQKHRRQATSLKLLGALNHANVQRKTKYLAMASRLKHMLQR